MAEICTNCGLPMDLCVCEELEKEETRIVVRLEMRRFKKPTTMIEGLNPKRTDLDRIAQRLKSRFACGGTAKNGYILLQGDHRDTIRDELVRLGFNDTSIEVQ
ncbi:MAG: translation initiation factor [Thaumarchaeota archaeon]|nr:translation initiation factor [Nitrososphaerota archaeon]MCL5317552.1 translation initiation factor [Nitrososphaerota archaeon]